MMVTLDLHAWQAVVAFARETRWILHSGCHAAEGVAWRRVALNLTLSLQVSAVRTACLFACACV
jgi:hypothetical protein